MSPTRSLLAAFMLLLSAPLFASIEVDSKPPPDTVAGPLGEPQNFHVNNDGTNKVQLYVAEDGAADDFPDDWEVGDELPDGWKEGAELDGGEDTTIGGEAGDRVAAHPVSGSNGKLTVTPL